MAVHKDRNHHRPRVGRLPLNSVWRTVFGHTWSSECGCGFFAPAGNWHVALVYALAHSRELR